MLLPYTYPTPKLSPHRRRCISIFPQKTHSVWFISVLNYGDTDKSPHKSPSPCNTYVIIQICVLINHINMPPHTHTHTWSSGHTHHTHTHLEQWTHTHTHTPGAVGSQRCGVRGAVGGSVPCSRVSPQSWTIPAGAENPQLQITSPALYPLGHDCPSIITYSYTVSYFTYSVAQWKVMHF